MNRPMASPWALHLGQCSLMPSWGPLKKLWFMKAKYLQYMRCVDDTLTIMPDTVSVPSFLLVLNNCHSLVKFTMERENNGLLPFL